MAAVLNTLSQPSTYAGLSGVAAAIGLSMPEFQAITAALAALCGLLAVFINERGT